MQTLINMTHNYILNTALLSWVAAQVLKFVFVFMMTGKLDTERLLGSGGMPSSHSAMVCALIIAIARSEGINTSIFAVTFVFSCVVMYDAMGVRRQAGEHAKMINLMMEKNYPSDPSKDEQDEKQDDEPDSQKKELKEILGHTPLEVLGGALLGILMAMIIPM